MALPDHRAPSPGFFQKPDGFLVPTHISKKFLRPIIDVGSGYPRPFAVPVRMPETTVHEHRRSPPGENEIRFSGQFGTMKSKAKTQRVRRFPHNHFGGRVLRFDLGHRPRAMGSVAFFGIGLAGSLSQPVLRVLDQMPCDELPFVRIALGEGAFEAVEYVVARVRHLLVLVHRLSRAPARTERTVALSKRFPPRRQFRSS